MNIAEILSGIQVNEEQTKALDAFFESYAKEIEQKVKSKLEATYKVDISKYIEKAKAEKAFNLFKEDADKAFNLFEKDSEKAFELYKEDTENTYTERFSKALSDVYTEVEARVKNDFLESVEYKTLNSIKEAIIPVIVSEDQKAIVESVEAKKKELSVISEEIETYKKDALIKKLLKDFPEEYTESVESFISKGKTQKEVIERFNEALEMLDVKAGTESFNESVSHKKSSFKRKAAKQVVTEDITKTPKKQVIVEDVTPSQPILQSVTKKDVFKKESRKYFTDEQLRMLKGVIPGLQ